MKKIKVNQIKEWLKTLEENKWRKTYDVDARRISHFANYGESTELPKSLQKKSKNVSYVREMKMAKQYIKHLKEQEKRIRSNRMNEGQLRNFIKSEIRKLIK
jgi:hypothetical protein